MRRARDQTRVVTVAIAAATRHRSLHALGGRRRPSWYDHLAEVEMAENEVGFASEIRPLFREKDVQSMSAKFDRYARKRLLDSKADLYLRP